MTDDRPNSLRFRSAELVTMLAGYIADADQALPWNNLVGYIADTSEYTPKTVENTLGELAQFGAIQRIGKYEGRGRDTRAVRITALGRAWLDQEIPPLPTHHDEEP